MPLCLPYLASTKIWSALVPLAGGILQPAAFFVDPALSFAMGWNAVYEICMSVPAEMVAAAVLVQFWITLNNAIWITVFSFLLPHVQYFYGKDLWRG